MALCTLCYHTFSWHREAISSAVVIHPSVSSLDMCKSRLRPVHGSRRYLWHVFCVAFPYLGLARLFSLVACRSLFVALRSLIEPAPFVVHRTILVALHHAECRSMFHVKQREHVPLARNAWCSACKNRAESICIRRMANLRGTHDVLQAARNEFEFTLRNGNTELHPPRYASSLHRYIFVKASHEPVPFFRIYTIYFRKSFSILHFQIYTIYFRKNVRLEKCEYILYIPEYIPLPLRTVVESLIEREIDAST